MGCLCLLCFSPASGTNYPSLRGRHPWAQMMPLQEAHSYVPRSGSHIILHDHTTQALCTGCGRSLFCRRPPCPPESRKANSKRSLGCQGPGRQVGESVLLMYHLDRKVLSRLSASPQACWPNVAHFGDDAIPAGDPPPYCPLAHLAPSGVERGWERQAPFPTTRVNVGFR